MSLLKTNDPGLLPKVVCTLHRMARCAIESASSMRYFASVVLFGGSSCMSVRKTLPTVWCMCSQMTLACDFYAVVGTSVMLEFFKSCWNSHPVNSPPLSWTHLVGHGYRACQTWSNFLAMWAEVFLSILTISTELVTVSMTVNALNVCGFQHIWTIQGPVKSTAASSKGPDLSSFPGNKPYPFPLNLCFWHVEHLKLYISLRRSTW